MKLSYVAVIALEARDIALAAANGGLNVTLVPETTQVTFRVAPVVRDELLRGEAEQNGKVA